MSKFIENHPSAIEVWLFYGREKGKSVLYERLCKVIGKSKISKEGFNKVFAKVKNMKQREIRQLVDNDPINLRLCILSVVIDKKSIVESVLSITKMIGTNDIDWQDFEFWFNRFSCGNWNLDQKTFSDMPIEILENVAERLDFPSQMRLRKVSSGLRDVVDQVKLSIDKLSCYFQERYPENSAKLTAYNTNGQKHEYERAWRSHERINFKREFDSIKVLLSNPRLQLAHFKWSNYTSRYTSPGIDAKFFDIINSLNHKIEIVHLDANLNGDLMIDLVKAVKPGTLEHIHCSRDCKPVHIDQLAQLEQWKQAKSVHFHQFLPGLSSFMHHFQHFESVYVRVEWVSIDELLYVRELFVQKHKLKYFEIDAENIPAESEIDKALGLSDFYWNEHGEYFHRRYDLPASNDYFEVGMAPYSISFERKTEGSDPRRIFVF